MDRLSGAASMEFVAYLRAAMKQRGLSVYGLFLLSDLRKPTLYRWFCGASSISIGGAAQILRALAGEGPSPYLDQAAALLAREGANASAEKRLLDELKARRLPRRRTLDALRAAGISGFE